MPLYIYYCDACNEYFVVQRPTLAPETDVICPLCSSAEAQQRYPAPLIARWKRPSSMAGYRPPLPVPIGASSVSNLTIDGNGQGNGIWVGEGHEMHTRDLRIINSNTAVTVEETARFVDQGSVIE